MKLNIGVGLEILNEKGNPVIYKLANVEYRLAQITTNKVQLYNNTGKIADFIGTLKNCEFLAIKAIEKNFIEKLGVLR